jgi:hypothetical protein
MTSLNYSLVQELQQQNTPCLRTICTLVCTSLHEKLATRSVFRTEIELDEDAFSSVDSELLLL